MRPYADAVGPTTYQLAEQVVRRFLLRPARPRMGAVLAGGIAIGVTGGQMRLPCRRPDIGAGRPSIPRVATKPPRRIGRRRPLLARPQVRLKGAPGVRA